jgi:copper resistance protein B
MKALLVLLLAGAATPAMAQSASNQPASAALATAQATCLPEHAAMGHCKLPDAASQAGEADAQQPACLPEHAAMGHCKLPDAAPQAPAVGKQPTCLPEHAAMGHCKLEATAEPQIGPAPTPAEALTGPVHAADAYWGAESMQRGRNILREEHGGMPVSKFLLDRAEARLRDGRDGYLFDMQAWHGGDIDKLWLKSEVEGSWGEKLEHAEVQGLWSHAIDPWFDLQAGVRYDPQPGPNRTHLVLGVQGLAPYWWEVEGAVFLSNKGDVTARAEAEYDLRITQKLILQPRVEVALSLQDVPELAIGSGLTSAALGLRLRYQISPLVAPYIGVEYERAFGDTRRFLRADDEDAGGLNLLAGVRFWF